MKHFILWFSVLVVDVSVQQAQAQCCAGGSGSPIAGGASQGVLQMHQVDINVNFQNISTKKFMTGSKPAQDFLDHFQSNYLYNRVGYGISKDFTMYVEAGYFLNKTQVALNKTETITSKGFGDLILFPRYDLVNKTKKNKRTELTVGLGFKIPLGKYNDSDRRVEPFSQEVYYVTKPLSVQPTSGAHDLIFYSFFLKDLTRFKIFANALYVNKGWNPIGEKMGNFFNVGLFISKSFRKSIGVTMQVRGEWIDKMKINKTVLLNAYPNYDPFATGSHKVFFVPQVSYSWQRQLTIYAMTEIPVYQYVVKTQIASQYQTTCGISYRFMVEKP